MRQVRALALALAALALASAALAAAPAMATFGIKSFSFGFTAADGSAEAQAGAHPFAATSGFSFNTVFHPGRGVEVPDGAAKDQRVELPPGLVGNPKAVPRCSSADFIDIERTAQLPNCPNSAVVGTVTAELEAPGSFWNFPVYNLQPPPGVPLKLGFIALTVPVAIEVKLNDSPPYNAIASVSYNPQAVPVYGASVSLWGNPADPAHDPFRGSCLDQPANSPVLSSKGNCPANTEQKPFITLPRSCTGPLRARFQATPWQGVADERFAEAPGMAGCAGLSLDPEVSARPTTQAAESASGLDFGLEIDDPGLSSPTSGAGQSDIRKSAVTLPEGMTLNPSAAAGLEACTLEGYASESLGQAPGEGCPQASKLGSVEVETPVLEGKVLEGSLFAAQQDDPARPGPENPFGSMIAVYIVIKDPELGILVKLAGEGKLDPQTGQVSTTFDEMPQAPISRARIHLREGPRGPLVTPPACGEYAIKAEFTPWAGGPPAKESASFQVTSGPGGSPCPAGPRPFHPGFSVGSLSSNAGSYSPLFARATRTDGEQDITRLGATLPPGLVAKIAGVPKCPEAAVAIAKAKTGREELAAPSCPAASQLGTTLAGAGVGSSLTYAGGKIYLGGPLAGNPLSLIAITPAVAGPFDAGTVALRLGLNIDPTTYRAKVDNSSSDPIPTILKGIPLRARDIRALADRPDFALNPTSCDPFATEAALSGSGGAQSSPRDPYQATNCSRLAFKPKLSLRLSGGTKRGGHPAFRAVLAPRPGDANIGKAVTVLPPSEFIDNAHIQNPCTRVQFNAGDCPKGSVLGTATAFSPLLDEPLRGSVYFRSNGGERLLPDIVLDLHGLFHIVSVGFVDSRNARLRTTFASIPDAPISKVILSLNGGKKGLLVNNRDLCARKLRATVAFTGQNGKASESRPVVQASCKGKAPQRAKRR
jgi:hypothetical protein